MINEFSSVVIASNVPGLISSLTSLITISISVLEVPPADEYKLDPSTLYVFAFSDCSPEMLKFMAKHSRESNFLSFYPRPSNGFIANQDELGGIVLLMKENLCRAAIDKVRVALA